MIYESYISSPIGTLKVVVSDRGVTEICHSRRKVTPQRHKKHPHLSLCLKELKRYFSGESTRFSVPLDMQMPKFQKDILNTLYKKIPHGKTTSYGDLATLSGHPGAARAVGGALNKNPLPILIPCHRVLNAKGQLHGFATGLLHKKTLLILEGWS